jgi:alpha-amylase
MRTFGQFLLLLAGTLLGEHGVSALSAAEWRVQSIYQVVTDRFARTDLSTTAPCDPSELVYCGGTWRGLLSKLDYIQGMGFTAVWISPVVKQIDGNSRDGRVATIVQRALISADQVLQVFVPRILG